MSTSERKHERREEDGLDIYGGNMVGILGDGW